MYSLEAIWNWFYAPKMKEQEFNETRNTSESERWATDGKLQLSKMEQNT